MENAKICRRCKKKFYASYHNCKLPYRYCRYCRAKMWNELVKISKEGKRDENQ